jgi:hypothetical protein
MTVIVLFFSICLVFAAFALLALVRLTYEQADFLIGLRSSMAYEAIALYDRNSDNPVFKWIPDSFARILKRERSPFLKEAHWDYWEWFRESRPDWDETIHRVLATGIAERRDGEVIIYPSGKEIVINWVCGPRYDAGRPWRSPRLCGFYITHVRSHPDEADREGLYGQIKAMEAERAKLTRLLQQQDREFANTVLGRLAKKLSDENHGGYALEPDPPGA